MRQFPPMRYVVSGLVLFGGGCPPISNNPPDGGTMVIDGPFIPTADMSWNGSIEADSIEIPAGITLRATENLTLRSNSTMEITGTVEADGEDGQSVTIEADGDVVITGRLTAGNGDGAAGGALTISSTNGNITLQDGSFIASGNGGDGTAPDIDETLEGGAGFNGGDISFEAPNGMLTFSSTPESVRVGNGGAGADVVITMAQQEQLTIAIPELFTNAGGNSGNIDANVMAVEGIVTETESVAEDILADDGSVIAAGGTTFNVVTSGQIVGGEGGDAGQVIIGSEAVDEGASEAGKTVVRLAQAGFGLFTKVEGAKGGVGYFFPGRGGDVQLTGCNAVIAGECGQSVEAIGGDGGDCSLLRAIVIGFIRCDGGSGGSAIAVGGNGATGAGPAETGGCGGTAEAKPGLSGLIAGVGNYGCIGNGSARGGDAGKGGDACPSMGAVGGMGGRGGRAEANFKPFVNSRPCNPLVAAGGNGGTGGNGVSSGGDGGARGAAFMDVAANGTVTNVPGTPGLMGLEGLRCTVSSIEGCGTPTDSPAAPRIPANGFSVQRVEFASGAGLFPLKARINGNNLAIGNYGDIIGANATAVTISNGVATAIQGFAAATNVDGITDDCVIVGSRPSPEAIGISIGYLCADCVATGGGEITDIGVLPGGESSRANAVSATGRVAVTSTTAVGRSRAAYWDGSQLIPLQVDDENVNSTALGMSSNGEAVAGQEGTSAVLWTGQNLDLRWVLPSLEPGGTSVATDVEGDKAVGSSLISATFAFQPVCWINGGTAVNLNTVGAARGGANAVNSEGVVVGVLGFEDFSLKGFIYTEEDGTMLLDELIDPAEQITILQAWDVNPWNRIIAVAADTTGQQHYVVLSPNE